jgi:hypothetical protein
MNPLDRDILYCECKDHMCSCEIEFEKDYECKKAHWQKMNVVTAMNRIQFHKRMQSKIDTFDEQKEQEK